MSKNKSENALALLKDQPATARERARHVVALCESLFAQGKHLHGLTKTSLRLLRMTAVIRQGMATGETTDRTALYRAARKTLAPAQWQIVHQAVEFEPSRLNGRARLTDLPGDKDAAMVGVVARIAAIVRIAEGLDSAGCQDTSIVGICDDGQEIDICVAKSPSAARNATEALRKTDWWNRVALRPVRSVVVVSEPCVGAISIGPHEDLAEGGRRILLRHLEQLISRQYGLASFDDPEYVHEMRVAIRRLRAAIRVFRKGFAGELESEGEQLRALADALGAARDADVFIEFLERYIETCPRKAQSLLVGLLASEKRQRKRHYQQLQEVFRTRRQRTFLRGLHRRLQRPVGAEGGLARLGRKQPNEASSRARKMLRRRLQRVMDFGRRLDLLTSDEQHQLRIVCKKLRYTAEFFTSAYPSRLQSLMGVVTRLQDLLGMSHDTDVYFDRLERYSLNRYGKKPGTRVLAALRITRARLRRIRKQCLRQAAVVWKSFTASQTQGAWKRLIAAPVGK